MNIKSDFKDYYDSALSYGVDKTINYIRIKREFVCYSLRNEKKITEPKDTLDVLKVPMGVLYKIPNVLTRCHLHPGFNEDLTIKPKLIGFCGKLYPCIEIDNMTFYNTDKISSKLSDSIISEFFKDRETLETSLSNSKLDYFGNRRRLGNFTDKSITHDSWIRSTQEIKCDTYDEVFIKLGTPVFKLVSGGYNCSCTLNPWLKNEQFEQIKNPVEAFQEISMYIGNQLAQQKDPVDKIPDDVMRDKKGFDKWSFRRHKDEK